MALVKLTVVVFVWVYGIVFVANFLGETLTTLFFFFWLFVAAPWMAVKFLRPLIQTVPYQLRWGRQAAQAIRLAKIPPVLYLRSFKFDVVAQRTNKSWLAPYAASAPEVDLAMRLMGRLGVRGAPLLAIGKPDELDLPAGALRFWVTNDLWKDTVSAIAPLCSLVIWTTGHTEGLDWEIRFLRTNVQPTRILLWLHTQFMRSKAERNAEWAKFIETYRDVFPKPLPANVSEIRFIAFDDEWTPIPIPSKRYPASLAERLQGWGSYTFGLGSFLNERIR